LPFDFLEHWQDLERRRALLESRSTQFGGVKLQISALRLHQGVHLAPIYLSREFQSDLEVSFIRAELLGLDSLQEGAV
jgi:hypothetical protein